MKGLPAPRPRVATVVEALEAAARSHTGVTFVDAREVEQRHLWSQVRQCSTEVARGLRARGIGPGDRVALVLPTGPEFLHAFFGSLLCGAVPVPLYPPVRLGRMNEYHRASARMLVAVAADLVVCDRRFRLLLGPSLQQARPRLGSSTVAELLAARLDADEATQPLPTPTDEALALIQFSSGSTVDPKPVALTHRQLVSQCAALEAMMPAAPGAPPTGVSWLPLYHDMGLIGCLLSGVYYPGELVLISPEQFLARPAMWLRALSRHRALISPAPNFAFGLCLKRIKDEELKGVDLSHWSFALNGAEPVSVEVMERFATRFSRWGFRAEALLPVYGLSEASLAVTFAPAGARPKYLEVDPAVLASRGEAVPGARRLASVGSPIPGVELEVRGPDGQVLASRQMGRVLVRGPSLMSGYFRQPEATGQVLRDGWLDTGDRGFLCDGELYLCGRAKDVIIIRGANHPAQEFEEALELLPGVRAGCVVAVGFTPEGEEGEALLLLVERLPDAPHELEQQIRAAVRERTSINPHTVRLLEPGTLPRTSSGKLRRSEALRRFTTETLTPPAKVTALRMGAELLRGGLALARARLDP